MRVILDVADEMFMTLFGLGEVFVKITNEICQRFDNVNYDVELYFVFEIECVASVSAAKMRQNVSW